MPRARASYAELVHQVVQGAFEPLPFLEIVRRVAAIAPIATRDPKGTVRGAITASRLVVATGDGRYGWKPRLIAGSKLRLTLTAADFTGDSLHYSAEVQDALYPASFGAYKHRDVGLVRLELPDGTRARLTLDQLQPGEWGTHSVVELSDLLATCAAQPGDHLLVRVVDAEARHYRVAFERRVDRDESAISERNASVVAAALAYFKGRANGAAMWELAAHLLSTGHYLAPVPPDPLDEIWTRDQWEPVMDVKGRWGGWADETTTVADPLAPAIEVDALLTQIHSVAESLRAQFDEPSNDPAQPTLPPEYLPGPNRRPRASRAAQRGPTEAVVLRVTHRQHPKTWREIAFALDQTLEDVHLATQQAYSWNDDHLYSFFMSGQAFDSETEIGSPWSDAARHTHEVTLADLALQPEQRFLYVFDYGDGHEFDIDVVRMIAAAPDAHYPRVVAQRGRSPRQYS